MNQQREGNNFQESDKIKNDNLKWEQEIRKHITGLTFIECTIENMQFKMHKCRSEEPVYILGYKLFNEEDNLFKQKEDKKLFDYSLKPKLDEISPLKEFEGFLKDNSSQYIHDFNSNKRLQQKENWFNIKRKKRQDPSTFEEESKSNNNDIYRISSKSQNEYDSKVAQQQMKQEMSNFVFIFNEEDKKDLLTIHQEIQRDYEQKNIIQLSHFMNLNIFHSVDSFDLHFQRMIEDLSNKYKINGQDQNSFQEQNNQSQTKKTSEIFKQYLRAIHLSLKGKSKIILFDSYYQATEQHQDEEISLIRKSNNHTLYILATEFIPDLEYISQTLHYYHKVSPYAIFSNIQQRLIRIAFNTVKDIIRLSLYDQIQADNDLYAGIEFFCDKKNIGQRLKDAWKEEETNSLVYKNICSHGLLPVNVILNNMKENSFMTLLKSNFIKVFGLHSPFPPKFHLNISIMNKFYSYNNSSIFHCNDIEYKEFRLRYDFYYTKIRIVDFFPLDQWVRNLGSVIQKNLLTRIGDLLRNEVIKKDIENYNNALDPHDEAQYDLYYSLIHKKLKDILQHATLIQTIKEISYQFMKEYFFELRVFQKWAKILVRTEEQFNLFQNNCQTGVSEFVDHLTSTLGGVYESTECTYDYKNLKTYFQEQEHINLLTKSKQQMDYIDYFERKCSLFNINKVHNSLDLNGDVIQDNNTNKSIKLFVNDNQNHQFNQSQNNNNSQSQENNNKKNNNENKENNDNVKINEVDNNQDQIIILQNQEDGIYLERKLKERIEQIEKERLRQLFQRFSAQVNYGYLDQYVKPLKLHYPIPKYQYYCELSHKNYVDAVSDASILNIEQFFLIVEDFIEPQSQEIKENKASQTDNKAKVLDNKQKKANKINKGNKPNKDAEGFDKTHQIIKNLILLAQKTVHSQKLQNYDNIQVQSRDSSNVDMKNQRFYSIISTLMNAYDSWYFQRKNREIVGAVNYSQMYEIKDILKELSYYYYNSVRLSSENLFKNDDYFSIVGHLIIKNPEKKITPFIQVNQ